MSDDPSGDVSDQPSIVSGGAASDEYSAAVTLPENDLETNALLSRLRVIEDQPLESRAAAYAQLHDSLQARLEGRDAASG